MIVTVTSTSILERIAAGLQDEKLSSNERYRYRKRSEVVAPGQPLIEWMCFPDPAS
jgi:hypothetical protein